MCPSQCNTSAIGFCGLLVMTCGPINTSCGCVSAVLLCRVAYVLVQIGPFYFAISAIEIQLNGILFLLGSDCIS